MNVKILNKVVNQSYGMLNFNEDQNIHVYMYIEEYQTTIIFRSFYDFRNICEVLRWTKFHAYTASLKRIFLQGYGRKFRI